MTNSVDSRAGTAPLDEDLAAAVFRALRIDGEACIEFAQDHSWQRSTERFLKLQLPNGRDPASVTGEPTLSPVDLGVPHR